MHPMTANMYPIEMKFFLPKEMRLAPTKGEATMIAT
jgi:hypothetical protein